MRLVLDTSVLVAALRNRTGASNRLLDWAGEGRIQLVASSSLLFEYEEVLSREEQVAVHGLSPESIEEFLTAVAGFTEEVHLDFRYRPQLRDADDEMVLEAAINGQAQAIVTHNVRDFLPAAHRFGVDVVTPRSMMQKGLRR